MLGVHLPVYIDIYMRGSVLSSSLTATALPPGALSRRCCSLQATATCPNVARGSRGSASCTGMCRLWKLRRGTCLSYVLLIATTPCDSKASARADVVASALNARFRAGRPSDDPASAGVVVHALDVRDSQLRRQLGVPGLIWRPHTPTGQLVSCSVINAQLPFAYKGAGKHGQAGFVLSSSAVKRALLCSYPWDSWTYMLGCPTNWRSSDTCVPGCPSEANQGLVPRVSRALTELQCSEDPRKCKAAAGSSPAGRETFSTGAVEMQEIWDGRERFRTRARAQNSSSPTVWPRLSLSQTMHLHQRHVRSALSELGGKLPALQRLNPYNELVLAADTLNSLLPKAIVAVYMPANANHVFRSSAHAVHADLLRSLNRTAQQLPLLELDMTNSLVPFRVAAP